MVKEKRKRIYYIPGIISLAILPILFICFAEREISSRAFSVLPILVYDKNLPKKYPAIFSYYRKSFPPKRNYDHIVFTGNEKNDNIKLDFAQVRIEEIVASNDSTNGLHFHFGDSSQYWTFVKAIDILRVSNAMSYIPVDNDLWIYNAPPDTTDGYKIPEMICTISVYEEETSWWAETLNQANRIWKSSGHLILVFMAFLIAIVLLKRKRRKTVLI